MKKSHAYMVHIRTTFEYDTIVYGTSKEEAINIVKEEIDDGSIDACDTSDFETKITSVIRY